MPKLDITKIKTSELNNQDYDSLTKEELQDVINQLENESIIYDTFQMAEKLGLNAIYGALANIHFRFFDVRLAETITLQGQDAIKFSEKILNDYFIKIFHNDKELLQVLKDKCSDVTLEPKPCVKPCVIYMDTDSVDKDTLINTNTGTYTIQDLYNKSNYSMGETLSGHESVSCIDKVLNWSENKGLYYSDVKRIIRHKVSKKKWLIKTKSGKEVIVTNDHSMIVFRDNKKLEIKPSEILTTDKILINVVEDSVLYNEYLIDEILVVECIGEFDNEYVYDIEVDDDTHTFIANDILVHNSCYVTFQEALDTCNWTGSVNDFVLTINEHRLDTYLKKCFEKYANFYNTDNYLDFELESIAYAGIWTAKKKYVQDISWQDGKVYKRYEKIKSKGLEIIQSSTPTFCRKYLYEMIKWIFTQGNDLVISKLASRLLEIKKLFLISDMDDLCKNTSIGDYDKYILNDRDKLQFAPKCPAHLQGAGLYNHILYKNPKLVNTYDVIKSGDKVKWYYTTHQTQDKFSYRAGEYPFEFAPKINYDIQFEKTLLNPINNIINSMDYPPLTADLSTISKLF